jgi:hypothetical protein
MRMLVTLVKLHRKFIQYTKVALKPLSHEKVCMEYNYMKRETRNNDIGKFQN